MMTTYKHAVRAILLSALVLPVMAVAGCTGMPPSGPPPTYNDVNKCQMLERDFRRLMYYYGASATKEAAMQIADEGKKSCSRGDPAEGVQRYHEAFTAAGYDAPSYATRVDQ
ncbi:MAG: hypothetical protein ACREUU_09780 [Gammaproteobacteria bacterium]